MDSPALTFPVHEEIDTGLLRPLFQPIFDLRRHRFLGYEGLIRGPAGTKLESPLELFRRARQLGQADHIERAARQRLIDAFRQARMKGTLFLNCSADLLFDTLTGNEALQQQDIVSRFGLHPSRIVLEITELERASFGQGFLQSLRRFRRLGFRFAIDDLGEGFSNARLWNELRPDIVKIDRHFIDGIDRDPFKRKFVKAIQGLADDFGVMLIAEGVETAEELRTVRDLRVHATQGFFIARPDATPPRAPSDGVLEELTRLQVTMPAGRSARGQQPSIATIMDYVEPVTLATTNNEVFARFEADTELQVLPVNAEGGRAEGLIHRYQFLDGFARPYRRELFGRKSCEAFMEAATIQVQVTQSVQESALDLSRSSTRQRLSGVIVVEKDRYVGLVTVQQLMAAITDLQVAAARYANPLTELPGNVPINEQIDRMLADGMPFVASYIDIDNFKPFNDHYGYSAGDDLILLVARLLTELCDAQLDFVGHVGGDDFFLIMQSPDWQIRLEGLFDPFDLGMRLLCAQDDLTAGGFHGETRRGDAIFHPLPTISIGAVSARPGQFESHRDLSDWLAKTKTVAKNQEGHTLFVERRDPDRSEC
jgi:EAL domain-containing protein (putative c-di-GMP-specific phosphodiesterase class I)/GGDEF domain-containing protein